MPCAGSALESVSSRRRGPVVNVRTSDGIRCIAPRARAAAPWAHVVAASLALLLGGLVYALDRGGLPQARWATLAGWVVAPWFGAVGGWLPSFVHPFAFSLFTAALRAPGARPAYLACAAWGLVNVAFELGQHPRVGPALAAHLQAAFGPTGVGRALADYFTLGRFDPADLAAATAGALAAAAWLRAAHPKEDRHAH